MAVVVFVDLAGFTSFAETRGDAVAAALLERFALKAMQIGRRLGLRPIKTIGDAVLFVGADPQSGIDAAAAFLEAFGPHNASLPVHVGVHCGDIVERDGDVYGRAVNLTARLVSAAAPGTALFSREVVAKARAWTRAVPAGTRVLRGLPKPIEVFRLATRPKTMAQ
ncbi:MAG: adenylate/guanylate cyclase domain-containing protein [Actinomycetota bacterium]